jgi:hypothetical protein
MHQQHIDIVQVVGIETEEKINTAPVNFYARR